MGGRCRRETGENRLRNYSNEELSDFYDQLPPPPKIAQLILGILLTVLSGFVIMVLWGWFIVPLGLVPISLAHAIGIDLLVTFIVTTNASNSTQTLFWDRFIFAIALTLVALMGGWIVHLFM